MNTHEFTKKINKLRLSNKEQWYAWQGTVNGKGVTLKGYETWLQLFIVNGVEQSLPMKLTVSDFKAELTQAVD